MFTLTIETDNAAFGDPSPHKSEVTFQCMAETARILRKCADLLERYSSGTLRDINGNEVGKYGFSE